MTLASLRPTLHPSGVLVSMASSQTHHSARLHSLVTLSEPWRAHRFQLSIHAPTPPGPLDRAGPTASIGSNALASNKNESQGPSSDRTAHGRVNIYIRCLVPTLSSPRIAEPMSHHAHLVLMLDAVDTLRPEAQGANPGQPLNGAPVPLRAPCLVGPLFCLSSPDSQMQHSATLQAGAVVRA